MYKKNYNRLSTYRKALLPCFSFFLVLFFLAFIVTQNIFAAGYTLSGKITDSSHNPILYSDIVVRDTKTQAPVGDTNSGIGGYYKVVIPQSGIYTISVTPPKGTTFQPTAITNFTISRDISLNIVLQSALGVSKSPSLSIPTRNPSTTPLQTPTTSPLSPQSQSPATTPQKTGRASAIVNIITGILLLCILLGAAGYFLRKKFFNRDEEESI